MQAPSAAQLAAFQPQSAFQEHPDPFARFLDRSSIYYASAPAPAPASPPPLRALDVPPSLAGFRTIAGGHPHCDWPDALPFLLPQPLHYDYPDPAAMSLPQPETALPYPASSAAPHTGAASAAATGSDITRSIRNACASNSRATSSRTSKQEGAGPRPREKKHACWMCEKSFDRPSTLRKHLLVHTGEKAFVCDTCGRRFGVASNLNRHVKRCILKPVNAANRAPQMATSTGTSAASTTTASSGGPGADAPPAAGDSPALPPIAASSSRSTQKRTRDGDVATSSSPPDSPTQAAPRPPAKRRRRAPSPSQWIPHSLADFNITPAEYTKPTAVPLPPVTAYKDPSSDEWIEERNSWDENVSLLPYHPRGWKGTLPGPAIGLGGKDVMNLGLVNGGTYVMGRLVMV